MTNPVLGVTRAVAVQVAATCLALMFLPIERLEAARAGLQAVLEEDLEEVNRIPQRLGTGNIIALSPELPGRLGPRQAADDLVN